MGHWVYVYGGETGFVKDNAGGFNVWMVKGQLLFESGTGTYALTTYTTEGAWRTPKSLSVGTDYAYQLERQGTNGSEYVTLYRLNYYNCKKYGNNYCMLQTTGSVYSLRRPVNVYNEAGNSLIYTIQANEKIVFANETILGTSYGITRGTNKFNEYDYQFIRVWGYKTVGGSYIQLGGGAPVYVDFEFHSLNPDNYDINTV